VVDADAALHWPDFRAAEWTFQHLAQIRAYAAGVPCIVQSRYPTRECIAWMVEGKAELFYTAELAQRRALGYPPFSRLVALTVLSANESAAPAADLARRLRAGLTPEGPSVLGPAPAPLARLRGRYRQRILVRGPSTPTTRAALRAAAAGWRPAHSHAALQIDVDPLDLL
jgi:primosomal protein N' (replication factor Y)